LNNMSGKSPLCGSDYFILAMDHQMRRSGLPGNYCRLVVCLGRSLNPQKIRQRIEKDPVFNWLSHVRLKRDLPLFLMNHYKHAKSNGAELLHEINPGVSDRREFCVKSNDLLHRQSGIWFELCRQSDGTFMLQLVWHHVLMDAIGAEFLLKRLASDESSDAAKDLFGCEGAPRRRSVGTYLKQFPKDFLHSQQAVHYITAKSQPPIHSTIRQPSPEAPLFPQSLLIEFEGETFQKIQEHCRHTGAQLRKGIFYLAAVCQTLKKLSAQFKTDDGALVVSVPVNQRRAGSNGPIFQNQITFQFFRIEPQQNDSLHNCLQHLQQQTIDQIRGDTHGACSSMMKVFCNIPIPLYSKILRLPSEGKLNSFSYAYTGSGLSGLTQMFDCNVLGVHHQAPLSWPPGLAIVFSARQQKLTCSVSYLKNGWLEQDCIFFKEELKRQLTGENLR